MCFTTKSTEHRASYSQAEELNKVPLPHKHVHLSLTVTDTDPNSVGERR